MTTEEIAKNYRDKVEEIIEKAKPFIFVEKHKKWEEFAKKELDIKRELCDDSVAIKGYLFEHSICIMEVMASDKDPIEASESICAILNVELNETFAAVMLITEFYKGGIAFYNGVTSQWNILENLSMEYGIDTKGVDKMIERIKAENIEYEKNEKKRENVTV